MYNIKMKKYFIYLPFIVLIAMNQSINASELKPLRWMSIATQPTDTLITQLSYLNLSQYNGQPVDTLLAHLPSGVTTMKITGWRSIRVAEILHVVYPNRVVVEIHVRNFQHMNPNWVNASNPTQNWSIPLFKKEAIAYTVIFNGPVCINGCQNENK
jgi:hypothetical protein